MRTHRPLRVGNLIRDELGKLILRELEFPDAIVTITNVTVTDKLDWAHVMVSVIPSAKSKAVLQTLTRNVSRLHRALFKKLNIRPMPHLRFAPDHGPENAARVEKILMEDNN
jgi:ribosome-binding factor A